MLAQVKKKALYLGNKSCEVWEPLYSVLPIFYKINKNKQGNTCALKCQIA